MTKAAPREEHPPSTLNECSTFRLV